MSADVGRRLRDEGLQPSSWANGPGERYAVHDHAYDKIIVVERGSIRFGLPDRSASIELATGDRLELPARTAHDAIIGPDGVACLEAHLPAGSVREPARRPAGAW